LNSGKKIHEFKFHPTKRNWALAASWAQCEFPRSSECNTRKELFATRNLGKEWYYVTDYVFDFEWGQSKHAKNKGVVIPDERIFVTRDPLQTKKQTDSKRERWSLKINLYVSDDWFKTSTELLKRGNTIRKTD
jgi:hypothetical protein